ncbi:hypothetical protein [Burkholderia guangdongensis]|uniref:hypothetical protein n=1 Tax=Burkholderia guangdongensis TaxID=1792500 RepID=UPI0015CB8A1C|nr:hypothetical protein [Burkholderia guangdongensis]
MKITRKAGLFFVIFLASSASVFSKNMAYTIEDKDLRPISRNVYEILAKDPSYTTFGTLGCKLVGEKIPLESSAPIFTYFVTTSDACGWGTALGPIWLVDELRRKVILSAGGYAVLIQSRVRNGFRDVKISSETSGSAESDYYSFGRIKYLRAKIRNRQSH